MSENNLDNLSKKPSQNSSSEAMIEFNNLRFKGEPKSFLPDMRGTIDSALELGKRFPKEDIIGFFVFKMPEDSHLMPLFENQLFSALVEYHNTNDTQNEYVDPTLLMGLDSIFPKTVAKNPEIRGESLFEHELQHFIEYQQQGRKGDFYVTLGLIKKQLGEKRFLSYKINSLPEDMLSFEDSLKIGFAPRYPSSGDMTIPIAKAGEEYKKGIGGKIHWFMMMSKIQKHMEQKARLQGVKNSPFQAGEMDKTLFPLWKEKRKNIINFPAWYKLTSMD